MFKLKLIQWCQLFLNKTEGKTKFSGVLEQELKRIKLKKRMSGEEEDTANINNCYCIGIKEIGQQPKEIIKVEKKMV